MNQIVKGNDAAWVQRLQQLINAALQLDEETLYALSQLEGKAIAFEFINTRLTLFLFPSEQGLNILNHYDGKPDVWIKGTPGHFFMLMRSARQGTARIPAELQIIGDIALAQRFQDIMQAIEIDLEEPLSKWVGDATACQIGRFLRGSSRFAVNTTKILARDISEYLRFEVELLPDDLLVEEFCNDVDRLREDVDRFDQGVNKLQARINKQATG